MKISFTASLVGSDLLVRLPQSASDKLPSRGMVIVEGTLNSISVRAALEPDGQGSHWFKINQALGKAIGSVEGDTVTLEIAPAKVWPDPELPLALRQALAADPEAAARWADITTIARWDWIRWMDSVKLDQTRRERPAKLCSMLKAGKRRPCCFNRALRSTPRSAEAL
jgi:hypothetical protein